MQKVKFVVCNTQAENMTHCNIMIRAASKATGRLVVNQTKRNCCTTQQQILIQSFHRSLSFNTNVSVVTDGPTLKQSFSTATVAIRKSRFGGGKPEDHENVLALPPNLKIDPSSTCSPVFGLNRISEVGTDAAPEDVDEETEDESVADEDENEIFDSDDDEEVLYSLENTPLTEPTYVIPLPERLHVPIFSLYPDSNNEATDDQGRPTPTELGTIHLSPFVFGQDPIRTDILHRVVIYQRNKKRGKRFPALTKTISTKSGSGKKMRPQKGSGRARAGHKRAAHWRGGAKAHGPKGVVQDYTTKLNKKVRKIGLRHALSQKLKEGNLILLDELRGESVKTKDLAMALETFEVGGKSEDVGATAVILDHAIDDEESVGGVNAVLKLASRNLFKIKMMNQLHANVYDILKYDKLIMSLSALQALEERLKE